MATNNKGSCILLVTIIFSIILIYSLNSWQSIIFNTELVQKKYEYEFNYKILESLHNFGIFTFLNNYRKISKRNFNNGTIKSFFLYNGPWPLNYDLEKIKTIKHMPEYKSSITVSINTEFATIDSKLINKETNQTYVIQCKLKKIITNSSESNKTRYLTYDWKF